MDYFWVAIGIMVALLAVQIAVSGGIDRRAAERRAEAQLPPPDPDAPLFPALWPDE